jgi:hypothetical protein
MGLNVIVHIHEYEYMPNNNMEMQYKIKNETQKMYTDIHSAER